MNTEPTKLRTHYRKGTAVISLYLSPEETAAYERIKVAVVEALGYELNLPVTVREAQLLAYAASTGLVTSLDGELAGDRYQITVKGLRLLQQGQRAGQSKRKTRK
jgi:hypothetical protein